MKLRVAGAQIPVKDDIRANVEAILRAVAFAGAEEADILVTPEGSLSGYRHDFDPREAAAALERVTSAAREAGVGLALGTCFVEPEDGPSEPRDASGSPGGGKCYNELRFYGKDGAFLGFHAKTLLCATLTRPPKGEIEHYGLRPLRTFRFEGVTVGGLVCNDLWASPPWTTMPDPHLTQRLSEMGARVVFHGVNGGSGENDWRNVIWNYHESNLRMRAKCGGLWIVTVNNCDPPDQRVAAPSGVVNPEGTFVCRTESKGERLFAHTIEL